MLFLAAGCASEDELPTPWVFGGVDSTDPAPLDAATLQAATEALVDLLAGLDPLDVFEAWEVGLARADGGCPAQESHNNMQYTGGDCETPDGTGFYGYLLTNHIGDFATADDEVPGSWVRDLWYATGGMRVVGTDGMLVAMLGDCTFEDYDDDDGDAAFALDLRGDFEAQGDGMPGGWLADGIGVDVDEPAGELWLWDRHDRWCEVVFDATCDGCGEARLDDASLGTVCADWSPLFDWVDRPWS